MYSYGLLGRGLWLLKYTRLTTLMNTLMAIVNFGSHIITCSPCTYIEATATGIYKAIITLPFILLQVVIMVMGNDSIDHIK